MAVRTFFGIALLWDWNANWPFQYCGHCWIFQICWHTECSTFTAFRIWNSSAEIPSPPLALFIAMLPRAHLSSYSRMSGSRWVTTPSWLSGSLRTFWYSSSVYSHHLLISSASVRSLLFLSFFVPVFAWNIPFVPNWMQSSGFRVLKIVMRNKKAFLSEQCKEIEENNRMGKTSNLLKKIGDTKGTFHTHMREEQ